MATIFVLRIRCMRLIRFMNKFGVRLSGLAAMICSSSPRNELGHLRSLEDVGAIPLGVSERDEEGTEHLYIIVIKSASGKTVYCKWKNCARAVSKSKELGVWMELKSSKIQFEIFKNPGLEGLWVAWGDLWRNLGSDCSENCRPGTPKTG